MSRKLFHIAHVESSALLPQNLTPGTAYFVDDEKYIVIDYGDGRGPITYGGAAGVIVNPTGNSGFLQDQINTLAGGVLTLEKDYWEETQYIRQQLTHIAGKTDEEISHLESLTEANSEGILYLAGLINDQANKTNAALSILTKAVTDIYEILNTEPAIVPDTGNSDPLDNETVETDAGSWVIQQTFNPDGSMTLELEAITLAVDVIETGEKLSYDGQEWTVTSIEREDGTISVELRQ